MKKLAFAMLFIMVVLVGCNSIDGTTSDDNQKVKDNQVVDMSGK